MLVVMGYRYLHGLFKCPVSGNFREFRYVIPEID